jgi:hypothetical protein
LPPRTRRSMGDSVAQCEGAWLGFVGWVDGGMWLARPHRKSEGDAYLAVRWEAVSREKWLWCSCGSVRACQSSRRKAGVWVRKEVVSVVDVWVGEEAASG